MIRLLLAASLIVSILYLAINLADHFSDVVDSRRAQIERATQ